MDMVKILTIFIIPMKIRLHRIFIICMKDKLTVIDRENEFYFRRIVTV